MTDPEHAPWLRVIDESGVERLRCGHLEVVLAPENQPPFPVAARIVEEDTWLILSASVTIRDSPDHPLRLLTNLLDVRPVSLGSVVVREDDPLQLLAVIHDFDRHPFCHPESIIQALSEACREAADRGLASIALPLLGNGHGGFSAVQSASVLARALAAAPHGGLRRVWMVVPDGVRQKVLKALLATGD